MWAWIESNAAVLTLLVLTATLLGVLAYTRAAFRQAEALVKPCLAPDFSEVRYEPAVEPFFAATLSGGNLILRNIGNGPALNVRYWLRKPEESWSAPMPIEGAAPGSAAGPGSPVGAGGVFDTGCAKKDVPEVAAFCAHYESLSRTKYESLGVIRDRKVVSTLRFRRIPRGRRRPSKEPKAAASPPSGT